MKIAECVSDKNVSVIGNKIGVSVNWKTGSVNDTVCLIGTVGAIGTVCLIGSVFVICMVFVIGTVFEIGIIVIGLGE